jgi:wyosine [tRNA(Phe)-imidazoG37] synthetase (radical SAM superfamily)
MYDMNLFENELEIEFQGGDIGALKEFIPLINEFELHGKHFYRFLTNNIVYYDEISKFLNEKRAQLCVSVDSGTQETYARIKGVDKFNVVVENLQRYIANSPELPNIILKYILLPSYNDNEYEMSKFIEMIKSLGMYFVIFDLDYRDIMIKSDKKFEIPQSYYESKTLFENIAKKYSISVAIPEYTQDILNRGSF